MTDLRSAAAFGTASRKGALAPGLPDPIHDSQRIFRCALTALSEPGRLLEFPVSLETTCRQLGAGVGPAALGLMLALVDGDTPIWLDRKAASVSTFLGFHTGAPLADNPGAARFALVADPAAGPGLPSFDPGSLDYPDRSATLILEASRLASGGQFGFSGPGIPTRRFLMIEGLPKGFAADWAVNHALFPCGVDVLIACGNQIVGLPRSTALEVSCM